MRVKRIAIVVVLLLIIATVVYLSVEQYFTTKQIYEGILVYGEKIGQMQRCV